MIKKHKLLDINFRHHKFSKLSCDEQYIENFEWDRIINTNTDELVVITDYMLSNHNTIKNKIAWLCESKRIINDIYTYIKYNYYLFKDIFTHDKDILDFCNNAKFVPVGGCWLWEQDQKIYEKTKLINIIASNKNLTDGHNLRHLVLSKFRNKIDVYGRNINTIQYKLEGLKDYMFQIVIENGKYDYYFTEKIIDCFRSGTIPIYWGCPSISRFFNENGIITFDNINELENIVNNISIEKYENMKPYIEENFEKAKEFLVSEYHILKNNLL